MTSDKTTIYKVTTLELWERGQADGILPPSPIDVTDGYMHLSTAEQLRETLRLHFAGKGDLVLAAVTVDAVSDALKWEPSRGGALFPHLFAPLPMEAISAHHVISVDVNGVSDVPAEIA